VIAIMALALGDGGANALHDLVGLVEAGLELQDLYR
jgi:hypothetical protein